MSESKIKSKTSVSFETTITLSESEARALLMMTRYGHKAFLEGYYKHLGKSYLQPHEGGIVSLFATINQQLEEPLSRIDKAKELINNI